MKEKNIVKVSESQKYKSNPFLESGIIKMDKGKSTVIAGSTKNILVDSESGEVQGVTILHKYKEVDKTQFVKLFVNEVSALFDLSKTGLKTFGYILTSLRPNDDIIYIYLPDLLKYAEWGSTVPAYRGLGELIANKIIAPSVKPNMWYINPNIVFNGDRVLFVKEYRLKQPKALPKQLSAFPEPKE